MLRLDDPNAHPTTGAREDGRAPVGPSGYTRRSFIGLTAGMVLALADCGQRGSPTLPRVDARQHGLAGDGLTNDQTALQALVNRLASAGGGTIHLRAGVYLIAGKPIVWRSRISLVGDGPGRTVVKLSNADDRLAPMTFIRNIAKTGASVRHPLADCSFDYFELDGSDVDPPYYDFGVKGFNIQYMLRARFSRLFVHDTVATGIGCDFLKDSVIEGCTASGCGRLNDGTQGGGAGIGIGVGGYPDALGGSWQDLNLEILDCVTNGNQTHGLFFEAQSQHARHVQSSGVRVVGHRSSGNRYGISDWGCQGISVSSSVATSNHLDGFNVGHGVGGYLSGGRGGTLRGVHLEGNGRSGFALVSAPPGRYKITDSRLSGNIGDGMLVLGGLQPDATDETMVCARNTLTANGATGVAVLAPTTGMVIEHCIISGNGANVALREADRAGIALVGPAHGARISDNDCGSDSVQRPGIYLSDQNKVLAAGLEQANQFTGAAGVVIGRS